jgi:dTDP-4-amino-4,6-dideoxy-D-galactose acyltransferase
MSKSSHLYQYLDWDSQFFGRKVARIKGNQLDLKSMAKIIKWCKTEAIDCIYFLCDSNDIRSIAIAEGHHFRLVDIRVTLNKKLELDPSQSIKNIKCIIRPFETEDIPILRAMARINHRNSRFYSDPGFPTDLCDALYESWIEKSCRGYADIVFVAEINNQPAGYISCHIFDQDKGQIGLLGVDPNFQGMGIGFQLIDQSLQWFARQKVNQVLVVTQGRNIKAQRLYQKCGFISHSLQLWYHGWFLKGDHN